MDVEINAHRAWRLTYMRKWLSCLILLALLSTCLTLPAMAENDTFAFDRSVTTLFEGETLSLTLNRAGGAASGDVTYVSSSEKNATVDAGGTVSGILKGRTTITASLKTDKRSYRATITLTVARKVSEIALDETGLSVYPAGDAGIVSLLKTETTLPTLVLSMGRTQTLNLSALPTDADNRRVTVTTSDEAVVTVSGRNLRPVALGECDLTVQSEQNPEVTLSYHVLVVQPITRVTLSAPEKSVYVGGTLTLTPAYTPEDATVKTVTWQSLNEKVATVDENGVVTGVGRGNVNIKATAADGSGRTASYAVRVMQQPTAITLQESDVTVNVGSYKTLRATVAPSNTDNKRVTWTSSDESVATVNASGRVTPVAPGTCTVTCASEDFPDVKTTAGITVHQLVTGVAFTEKEVTFNVDTTLKIYWQTSPANASDPSVTLSSSNEKIATVDQDGTIHGIKRGSCTITAVSNDGGNRRARIKVNILQPVEGVHMKNDTIRVGVDETSYGRAVLEPEDASNTHMTWVSADTSIAKVKGSRTKPAVTGVRWGTTTITGTTEDGGFTTSATVKVGNYDKALKITDLYLEGDKIKIAVKNLSNMNITKFNFTITCYDVNDQPLPCNANGTNTFDGSYGNTLYEGDTTSHGRFYFGDFVQPTGIGRVVMVITGYRTDEGYSRTIKTENQQPVEFKSASFVGAVTP